MRIALTLALAALPCTAGATDYWVKNGGSDAGNGQSVATAWATLGHAAAVVNAGDTVHVVDGSYQGFYLSRSGAPGSPITFHAEGPSVQITADNGTTPDGINVEGAAWVVIDGFVVDNRTRAGIRTALSQHVTVRNCHTGFNGRWGIFSGFADDFTIEDNETHHSVAEHGIYVSNSGDRPIIRRNHVHDNHANGIHMNGDASQGGDGVISNALVERNVIHGNGAGGGSGINMDGVSNSVVQNNLLYDNHASGISLYRIDGATGSQNDRVVNNTIVVASDGRWAVNISGGSTGNTVANNILYDLHAFRGAITIDAASRPGFGSDHNSVISRFSTDGGDTVISLATWQALGYDAHSFVATPADNFVTPGTDFHLLDTSPALDAGTASGAPADDLEGNARPVGAGVDLGAYERQLLTCGDGTVDAGEQCGDPGLACTDPCRHCAGCVCVLDPPVCGDGNVCGAEECESDGDCGGGLTCQGCTCQNPLACTSGIPLAKAGVTLKTSPATVRVKGQAVIAKPWQAVNPPLQGFRVVVDTTSGTGGADVVVPGGAGWKTNATGTRWSYVDAGKTLHAMVKDRSSVQDGLLVFSVKRTGGTVALPAPDQVRTTVVLGNADECAALAWHAPGGTRPRCDATPAKLGCR